MGPAPALYACAECGPSAQYPPPSQANMHFIAFHSFSFGRCLAQPARQAASMRPDEPEAGLRFLLHALLSGGDCQDSWVWIAFTPPLFGPALGDSGFGRQGILGLKFPMIISLDFRIAIFIAFELSS